MARTPSHAMNASPEAEVVSGGGQIQEGTQVSLTIGTQIMVVTTVIAITFAAAAAWFTTKQDIAETKAQTTVLQAQVAAYINDSNEKWRQYALDRAQDREESRKWREELRDAVRALQPR